jgi:hypothetical protein
VVAVTRRVALGRLADGTPYFAPLGEVPYDPDEDRSQCHLCGDWFRVVGGLHIRRRHGWTIDSYREEFGLLKHEPTCARGVSEKLLVRTKARLVSGELSPVTPYRKPAGAGGRGVRRARSLGALRPDLVAELHPDLNRELDVFSVGVKSGRSVWWRCRDCGSEWRAAPHDRSRGGGCPRCAQRRRNEANRRVARERSLAVTRPDLLAELHPTLNEELDPYAVALWSREKVWWRCPLCANEWRTDPGSRARGAGCPRCGRARTASAVGRANGSVSPARSLAVKRPELAAELHPTRNGGLDPLALAA